jgi:O-antigen/teichoic acid export membrane protein
MDNMDTANLGIMCGIIISLGFFAMIFGIVYLYKRERMAMIERGMDPRRYRQQSAPYQTLKWGLLLIGAGVGLFLANVLDRTVFNRFEDENVAIYFALIAMFGGLGLFASFRMEKKELDNNPRSEQV